MNRSTVCVFDRVASVLSYLTAGWGGIVIWVLMYLRKKTPSGFLSFNILQSIFISFLFFIISMGFELVANVLKFIPLINYLVAQISFVLNRPIFFGWSFLQSVMVGLLIYQVVFSLLGKYPRIYWLSSVVDRNVR